MTTSRTPRLAGRLLLLASLLPAVLAVAPPAQAAATCSGSGCNGKDPQTYGCYSDAKPLASLSLNHGTSTMTLFYSRKCTANWARITTPSFSLGANIWVENALGDSYSTGSVEYGYSDTHMVNGEPIARACAVDNSGYPPSHPGCTGWF
ncbi:DUF2690 domain-containing protein [Microbispora sp. NEAU-D428]|uniref:DUF2690 domain-containing protein n=1 Tax=Microbispora sitophila TaxID=2771537 RepID=UPI0018695BBC|nr:DUF2690 domain-containing protein [Microbispora sitophila]MBE3009036.1 DUF2690 domain-containing protein [Microbispora sitophila]